MTAVAKVNKASILQQLAQGRYVKDIAAELNIVPEAITAALSDDPDYQAARLAGTALRLEQREEEMERADDGISLARTRELLSHARWRAEREFPERWGNRQQIDIKSVSYIDDLRKISQAKLVGSGSTTRKRNAALLRNPNSKGKRR